MQLYYTVHTTHSILDDYINWIFDCCEGDNWYWDRSVWGNVITLWCHWCCSYLHNCSLALSLGTPASCPDPLSFSPILSSNSAETGTGFLCIDPDIINSDTWHVVTTPHHFICQPLIISQSIRNWFVQILNDN